jgi:hypothetical protein
MSDAPNRYAETVERVNRHVRCVSKITLIVFSLSVVCATLFSCSHYSASFPSSISVFVLIGGGTFILGAIVGLLFSIPRFIARKDGLAPENPLVNGNNGDSYRPNTQLEEIGDWLTKIIVGVGLTQLT